MSSPPIPHDIPIPGRASKRPPSPWTKHPPQLPPVPFLPTSQPAIGSNNSVILLAKQAFKKAVEDVQGSAEEKTERAGTLTTTGITVDLSHNSITTVPREAIDIINHDLERLALSHNLLATLPSYLSMCTTLRYLNLRHNAIVAFPNVLCELSTLEILDVSKNRLKDLPDGIAKLSSLKVLAIQRNSIQVLPFCLADMTLLRVLKLDGNPVEQSIQEIMRENALDAAKAGRENESLVVSTTVLIKQFLRKKAQASAWALSLEPGNMSSKDTLVAPQSSKRYRGSRFPVKVNGINMTTSSQSSSSVKSHGSSMSQHSVTFRSPKPTPHTFRDSRKLSQSVSETPQPHEKPRNYSHSQRDGLILSPSPVARDCHEIPSFDRSSQHLRGFSLSEATTHTTSRSVSKSDGLSVEELCAIIPPRSTRSMPHEPSLEIYRTIFFSLYQLHWLVKLLITLLNGNTKMEPSIHVLVYYADSYLSTLGRLIEGQNHLGRSDSEAENAGGNIRLVCTNLTKTYFDICSNLERNVDLLVDTGDFRYIQHLASLFYNSITGLRCAFGEKPTEHGSLANTITPKRQGNILRNEERMAVQQDIAFPPSLTQRRIKQVSPHVPIKTSWDNLTLMKTNPILDPHSTEPDPHLSYFDKIVEKACRLVLTTLPALSSQYSAELEEAEIQKAPHLVVQTWRSLAHVCGNTIQLAESLQNSIQTTNSSSHHSIMPSRDICYNFAAAWADLGSQIQQSARTLPLSAEMKSKLRQIQGYVKEMMNHALATSPNTPLSQTAWPFPITPQRAALGPATRAVVPD